MRIEEPIGPWYINVSHYEFKYRPICCSAVDYNHAVLRKEIAKVSCAKCLREVDSMMKNMEYAHDK